MPFVKLDCGILNSTLWYERAAREVFLTALLMAEPFETEVPLPQIEVDRLEATGWCVPPGWYGFVPASGVGILRRAGLGDTEGIEALRLLGSPEMLSRSQDFDGRRLARVDGGFVVLNYMKYRDRDYTAADRSRRYRERIASRRDATATHRDITQAEEEIRSRSRDQKQISEESLHVENPIQLGTVGSSATALTRSAKPILRFRTIGSGPKEWHLTQEQLDEWMGDYPGLDILAECRKAGAWLKANGYKTSKGMPRFFVAWFNRAVSNGANRGARPYSPVSAVTEGNMEAAKRLIDRVKSGGIDDGK